MNDHKDTYYHKVGGFIKWIAPWYDALVGPGMRPKAVRAAGMLGEIKGLEALDVCTGTSILAYELAGRGARITAIDLSPAMLHRARKKLNGVGPLFQLQDASRMSFQDKAFHLSAISMGLHEMLQEVWRWGVSLVEMLERGFYHEFIGGGLENLLLETGFIIEEYADLDTIGIFICRPKLTQPGTHGRVDGQIEGGNG